MWQNFYTFAHYMTETSQLAPPKFEPLLNSGQAARLSWIHQKTFARGGQTRRDSWSTHGRTVALHHIFRDVVEKQRDA